MKVQRYRAYLAATLVVVIGALAFVLVTGSSPRLGLDLQGGTSVILTARGAGVTDEAVDKTVDIIRRRIDALGVAEPEVSAAGASNILVQLPGVENEQRALDVIGSTAQLTFRQVQKIAQPSIKDTPKVTKETDSSVNRETVVYPSGQADERGTLYTLGPAVLTGDVVTKASAVVDPQSSAWSVSLDMNDEGARKWASFTSRLACLRDKGEQVKEQVAIVLDGKVESAAGMQPPSGGGGGVECGTGITGGATQINTSGEQEAKDLALVLRYGSLPITLEQSQVSKVSPTLGRDSLDAGLKAGALGLALVLVYVLLYYRALGLVVWGGLALFTAAMYCIMTFLGASIGLSLSLAGVAGVIVSIGVTTDSYIVAFERLKDEIRSGKSMRAAVERGTARALRTILVADFVTGAAAVILFFLAVGPVQGFALTLGIATLVDILIAFFFTRSSVHLLARTRLWSSGRFIGMSEALGGGTGDGAARRRALQGGRT
jgi:preprotein translocase subunit SecD